MFSATRRVFTLCCIFLCSLFIIILVFNKQLTKENVLLSQSEHFKDTKEVQKYPDISAIKEDTNRGPKKRRFPDCIIIGVMKGGTGALKEFLTIHPRVETHEIGEVAYFNHHYDRGYQWYRMQMPKTNKNQITLEKSIYFGGYQNPERVAKKLPDAKLIVIFRDPVERIISHYVHMKDIGIIKKTKTLSSLVLNKNGNVEPLSKAVRAGIYVKFLRNWLKYYPEKNIHLIDGHAFIKDPVTELNKIETFLGIEHYISKNNLFYNEKKGFFCMVKRDKESCLSKKKGRKHPEIDETLLKKLRNYFHPYNVLFFNQIHRQFPWKYEQQYYEEYRNVTYESEVKRLKSLDNEDSPSGLLSIYLQGD